MSGAGNLRVPQVYTSFDDDNVLLTSVNESTFKVTPAREGSSRRSRDTHKTTPLSSSRDIIRYFFHLQFSLLYDLELANLLVLPFINQSAGGKLFLFCKPTLEMLKKVPKFLSLKVSLCFSNASNTDTLEYIIPSIHQAITKIGSIARLCHPATAQIVDTYKSKKGRCGYVNAQMMLSALMVICPEKFVDSELLGIPSITEIQNLVEKSWDNGISPFLPS